MNRELLKTKIPSGAFVLVTTGAYSDYSVEALCVANQQIDMESIRADYLARYPEQSAAYHFNDSQFLAELVKRGLLSEVPYFECLLSEYSTAAEMWIRNYSAKESDE